MSVSTMTAGSSLGGGGSDRRSTSGGSSRLTSSRIRETIHSGHFMVSDFEPESEAQDEEYEVGMPIPPGPPETALTAVKSGEGSEDDNNGRRGSVEGSAIEVKLGGAVGAAGELMMSQMGLIPSVVGMIQQKEDDSSVSLSIDQSLTKLFQCMSLAYRQKLTSPKWNRFKGVRLRWKDKIRLNNVIWRCWHMQFIMKKKTLVCQFASPLDTDGHNKPEAVVMEGKYWKRKLSTVAAEYKKWRLFYRNRIMGWSHNTPTPDLHPVSLDGFDWSRSGTFGGMSNIIFDDDLLMDFTDTLFSSLSSNQPFAFPNPREIARAGMVADFIQPGLVQLQPNLDDFMDTLEPLHDYVNSKLLPPVPEELENFAPPESLLSEEVLENTKGAVGQTSYYEPLLQQSHQQPQPVKPSDTKHELLFVKPQGKPRGKGRPGQGGRGLPPPPSTNTALLNSSNTLLSHLLANNNHHNAQQHQQHQHSQQGGGNGNGGGGQQQYGSQQSGGEMGSSSSLMMGEMQSPSSWTKELNQQPFHLSNTPLVINFGGMGSKPPGSLMPGGSSLGGSSGGSGGGSPPLQQGGQGSPPMGPPLSGPTSPSKSLGRKSGSTSGSGEGDRGQYKEHRRVCHINAEQKRRCNIKNGFDTLHSLIPQLSHNPNAKVSKAAMLAKGAEYIRQLKVERTQLKEEMESHRLQVESLNAAINSCQSMLPATGAPVSRQRTNKMHDMFHQWVRIRTLENWKFWIFSTLIRPLLDSYNNSVSTASVDEMCRTVLAWVDQHCSLVDLRPAVLNSLRYLCTTTDILSNPANLPDEAYKAVNSQQSNQNQPSDSR